MEVSTRNEACNDGLGLTLVKSPASHSRPKTTPRRPCNSNVLGKAQTVVICCHQKWVLKPVESARTLTHWFYQVYHLTSTVPVGFRDNHFHQGTEANQPHLSCLGRGFQGMELVCVFLWGVWKNT